MTTKTEGRAVVRSGWWNVPQAIRDAKAAAAAHGITVSNVKAVGAEIRRDDPRQMNVKIVAEGATETDAIWFKLRCD